MKLQRLYGACWPDCYIYPMFLILIGTTNNVEQNGDFKVFPCKFVVRSFYQKFIWRQVTVHFNFTVHNSHDYRNYSTCSTALLQCLACYTRLCDGSYVIGVCKIDWLL